MKTIVRNIHLFIMVITGFILASATCYGQMQTGRDAPPLSLGDLHGRTHDLSSMKEQPLLILYFFDVESRPSQEGLLSLDRIAAKYGEGRLNVWPITLSPKEKVSGFVSQTGLGFPVLIDNGAVSKLYNAEMVLPTVCVIGPGLKVLDYFQGGGKTTEIMLVRIAERELQQKHTNVATAITSDIIKKNPDNVKALTVKGYAALKENRLDEAEHLFSSLSRRNDEGEILGKEGLAAVFVKKNQTDKALKLVAELEQKAPERSYPHVIKGDILYAQNKKKEAEKAYRTAVGKTAAEPYQEAVRYNQLGRMYAGSGEYAKARELYDKAVTIDPYYIEGTTNKGITYEKEGKWDKALESYRQALALDKNDTFAATLLKKAEEMINIQKDIARNKRVDQLVKDLAERYRSNTKSKKTKEDTWTSGPMVMTFVDFQERGGLAERDGFSSVLMSQLADHLNASGRVRVVERVVIERLLEELNLGSSDLADPETALKIGKVLAAKLLGTGSIFYLQQGTLLHLRIIDTETSAIPQSLTSRIDPGMSMEKDLFRINRDILRTVIEKYPLRGYIVQGTGDEFMINLGSDQGVVSGTKFDVVEKKEPVKYRGKLLNGAPRTIAQVEVVRVEPDICFVRVIKSERPLRADDMVQEKIEEAAL